MSSPSDSTPVIPNRLPVLPLPYPLVLHPSLLLSIPLSYAHSLSLLKAALQATGAFDGQDDSAATTNPSSPLVDASKPILVACIPTLKPQPPSATTTSSKSDNGKGDSTPTVPTVKVNDLHEWGVVARLMRMTRQPATETCILTVTGLARIRVDRWLSMRAPLTSSALDAARNITVPDVPVPLAACTTFSDDAVYPGAANASSMREHVHALRVNALELLDAIMSLHATTGSAAVFGSTAIPLMPPALIRKIRTFVREARDSQAPQLADVLIGSLGGACEWKDRLAVLADYEPWERVRHSAKVLSIGAARVRLARELLTSLAAPLNDSAKETLIRSQLEALLSQLAALNPNISAKITTSSGSFSINGSDKSGNVGGIIRIRAPNGKPSSNGEGGPRPLTKSGGNPFRGLGGLPGGGRPSQGGGGDDASEEEDEVAELTRKLDAAQLTPEARKVCDRELKRLARIPPQSVERGVVLSYLEIMAELPWDKVSADLEQVKVPERNKQAASPSDDTARVTGHDTLAEAASRQGADDEGIVARARRILDEDHFGMEKVKKRLVEYLAVLELKEAQARERIEREEREARAQGDQVDASAKAIKPAHEEAGLQEDGAAAEEESAAGSSNPEADMIRKIRRATSKDKGPILLLVGPPGTGKTSIARSLATALRRPFTRLSLGGVRDEASLRGHRRTYVGALPGEIVSSLRKVGVSDPVLLLDEIDKLGSGNGLHGDPAAAMLEVLDPEQNGSFVDHYLSVPTDLSRVLFIATANTLDTIHPALLDRTEVIQISGYTHDEKVHIARSYLVPKAIKSVGLTDQDVKLSDEVLLKVAMSYTREAGVRSLERCVATVVRGKAVEFAEHRKGQREVYEPVVKMEDLRTYLGLETYEPEVAQRRARPGTATGLAYQGSGSGGLLFIETLLLPPGSGQLKLTGSLGDVIKESAQLALSWVQAHAYDLGITTSPDAPFPKNDIHLHLSPGAVQKDGPSAGVATTCALVSLFTKRPIPPNLAMTGEISLRGNVLPVGGIKEKTLGAHRAGIKRLLLPTRNRQDVEEDVPKSVRQALSIVHVDNVWNVLAEVFADEEGMETQKWLEQGEMARM